jgi:acetylornithine deacetylase/succinyl-diaminopimelate desuccinylase-like protein
MYARGSADDKAGVLVHLAAIKSFLKTYGKLPVNVKCLIEGEEEAGSTYLPQYLQKVEEQIESFNSTDVLVLTDTANFDCGVPSLTVALRGLVALDVEVQALHKTVHSGMWGGPVPDPVMALSKMLATLTDDQGRIAIESIVQTIPQWTDQDSQEIKNLPYDEADFRKQSGMIDQAQLLKQGPHPVAQLWKFPSLTVNAIQASSREQAGNIICDRAWARITIRVVAGMDPVFVLNELKKHLSQSGFDSEYGARPLKRLIQRELGNTLSEINSEVPGGTVRADKLGNFGSRDKIIEFFEIKGKK